MQGTSVNIKTKKPGKTTAFFICVLVASFLWLVRALNTTYNYSLRVPVEFKNIPQNKKPLQSLPDRLNIQVKASGLKIILILASRPFKPLIIDFNELKSLNKQLSFVLTPGTVKLRPSTRFEAQIVQVSPDTLYFAEKSGFHKIVPVKALVSINCAPGYSCRKPEFSPAFISITGDSNSIRSVDTLYTQNFHLTNVSSSVQKQLDVIKPSSDIFVDNAKVDVKIDVDRLSEQIISIPVEVAGNPASLQTVHLFPSKVEVKYTTLYGLRKEVESSMFKAVIDVGKRQKDSKAPVVLTTVPGDVTIISITPPEVEYLIIKK